MRWTRLSLEILHCKLTCFKPNGTQNVHMPHKLSFSFKKHKPMTKKLLLLIHLADSQSRPVVIIVFTHVVSKSVRSHFSNSGKTKQISSENSVHYCRHCGSGPVDHWWQKSFLFSIIFRQLKTAALFSLESKSSPKDLKIIFLQFIMP